MGSTVLTYSIYQPQWSKSKMRIMPHGSESKHSLKFHIIRYEVVRVRAPSLLSLHINYNKQSLSEFENFLLVEDLFTYCAFHVGFAEKLSYVIVPFQAGPNSNNLNFSNGNNLPL